MTNTTVMITLFIAGFSYAEEPANKKNDSIQPKVTIENELLEDRSLTKEQKLEISKVMKAKHKEIDKEIELLRANKKLGVVKKELAVRNTKRKSLSMPKEMTKESHKNKIKAILTEDQKNKFEEKWTKRSEKLPKLKIQPQPLKDK